MPGRPQAAGHQTATSETAGEWRRIRSWRRGGTRLPARSLCRKRRNRSIASVGASLAGTCKPSGKQREIQLRGVYPLVKNLFDRWQPEAPSEAVDLRREHSVQHEEVEEAKYPVLQ